MVVYLRGRITTAEDEGFVAVFGRSNTQLLVYFLFFVFVCFFFGGGRRVWGQDVIVIQVLHVYRHLLAWSLISFPLFSEEEIHISKNDLTICGTGF